MQETRSHYACRVHLPPVLGVLFIALYGELLYFPAPICESLVPNGWGWLFRVEYTDLAELISR